MQPHYERKLEHALTLIKECAAKKIEEDNFAVKEYDSISAIRLYNNLLNGAFGTCDMAKQKIATKEIAATAILYIVEFL